uniref:acetyl-CoA carboxylase carboxyltransferase beta subunit n=1 Tax=Joinvillea sp. Yi14364 TaxID=2919622 RepID=UPI001F13A738|nr:acetyl-CoA carboxylase carboxyltransferase beta subunit [Joinvillea sp. Yi14364]ULQ66466.1 acetyl-CoA carboxylase carboxyltransferase beta subunit [Joinvillea sp. Yi14364]
MQVPASTKLHVRSMRALVRPYTYIKICPALTRLGLFPNGASLLKGIRRYFEQELNSKEEQESAEEGKPTSEEKPSSEEEPDSEEELEWELENNYMALMWYDQKETGLAEAGLGLLEDIRIAIAVMDFEFRGGKYRICSR